MKPATRAPLYACLYPGLCDIARKHGYALAIHGSMVTDLDLVAIPWTEEAGDPEKMVKDLKGLVDACLYPELLERYGMSEENQRKALEGVGGPCPHPKPHGRLAWTLHLDQGSYVDLSVLPRIPLP